MRVPTADAGCSGPMDAGPELRELLSPEGLRLLDERRADRVDAPTSCASSSRLRAAGPLRRPRRRRAQPGAAARQGARPSSATSPTRMLFTEDGLEQATRLRVAALHAGRFARRRASMSSPTSAAASAPTRSPSPPSTSRCIAVERDEVTAAVAAYNLAPFPRRPRRARRRRDADLAGVDGVWLDPARRAGGRRLADPADWSPSLDLAFGLAARLPTGIKLGPGIDRDLIPDDAEAQWVSVDRDVVELVALVRRARARRASAARRSCSASTAPPS